MPDRQGPDLFVNPMVCVCVSTVADPRIAYGQCPVCKRKPLALMEAR